MYNGRFVLEKKVVEHEKSGQSRFILVNGRLFLPGMSAVPKQEPPPSLVSHKA